MRPPTRIDVSQRTFMGFTYRQIAIFAVTAIVTVGLFGLLKSAPLFLRVALGILGVGIGLAFAFGEIEGKSPEAWLWGLLRFGRRSRFMVHGAMQDGVDTRRVELSETTLDGQPTTSAAGTMVAPVARPSFFLLSANAIGLSILAGLTIWLAQGGAAQLQVVLGKNF